MKHALLILSLFLSVAILTPAMAAPRRSLLDDDPDVIYLKYHVDKPIFLIVSKKTDVFSSKNAAHKLGSFPANTQVELLAIGGENAYQVRGKAKNRKIAGWVSPKQLTSTDKNFIANLKQLYERELLVKDLIEHGDVAIGMTLDEVKLSIGKPTKTEIKQTRKGESGTWEYIVAKEEKHYRTILDPRTGQVYRQLSHVTTEEKERTTLEFEDNVVTSVTKMKNNGPGKVRIIPIPVIFGW